MIEYWYNIDLQGAIDLLIKSTTKVNPVNHFWTGVCVWCVSVFGKRGGGGGGRVMSHAVLLCKWYWFLLVYVFCLNYCHMNIYFSRTSISSEWLGHSRWIHKWWPGKCGYGGTILSHSIRYTLSVWCVIQVDGVTSTTRADAYSILALSALDGLPQLFFYILLQIAL